MNILNNYLVNPPPDPRLPASGAPHVVGEFIQSDASPEALAGEALRLLGDSVARETLAARLEGIVRTLRAEGAGKRAAKALLDSVNESQASSTP